MFQHKFSRLSIGVVVLLVMLALPRAAQGDITSNLVAHWQLDETSGTSAADSSGNGHTGTFSGSPTWSTTGIHDGSLDFETSDGNDRVDTGNFDVTGTALTLAAWIRQETPLYDGRIIIKSDGEGTSNQSWGLAIDEFGELDLRINAGGTWQRLQAPAVISPNTWYHVAGTYDGTTMRLYLNGQLIASSTHSPGGAIVGNSAHTVSLGDSVTGARPFDGLIDDARVYSRTLSATDILELAGTLVGHWKLDETSGATAADSSAFGNDGTVNGTTTWTSATYGNGHDFDYTDGEDYVEIPNSALLENAQEGSYTVAAWFKPHSTPPGTGSDNDAFYGIVLKEGFYCGLAYTNANEFQLDHWITGDVWSGTGTWGTSYPPGKYYHVAGVVDIAAGTTKIYVNGALIYTGSFTPGTATREYGTAQWRIGVGYPGASTYGWAADGTVDDARIYSHALTDEEVADLYDLQGHWRLDESSGTNANDSSPQGHDGAYNGGSTLAVEGAYPGDVLTAVDFDGVDDEVDLPDMNIDFSYGLTAAFWVKPADTPGSGQGYAFLDLGNGQDVDEIWIGWFDAVGFQLYMTDTDDGSTLKTIEDNTGFEEGKWVHCVATVDAAGNAILYRNGEVTKSGFYTSIPTNVTRTVNTIATSAWNDEFPGTLDDVRLYNRPLSATEVSELYGLTGHWKMDEGAGSTAADSTGSANDATLVGATWTSDCAGNNGLEFDGLNDTAATNSFFDPPERGTVALWFRSDGPPAARQRPWGVGSDFEMWQDPDGFVSCDISTDGFQGGFITTDPLFMDGRWYHFIAEYDSDDDSYAIYINGALHKSGISTWAMTKQAANTLTFGTRTGIAEYFEGGIRDFRVYNRPLSGSEISGLSGLVAYWKLDESSGTVAVDSSANSNDGTYTNGVLLNQTGNIDQAADFDGSNDYVGVPDDSTLQMDDVFSISGWIRPDSSSNVDQMILNKEGEYEIAISPSDELKWGITNTDPGWSWHATGHIVAIGKWTHVALTYDNGTVSTYANGVLVDTYNGSGVVGDNYTSLNELRLGGRSNNPAGKYFDGRLDDIRVFKRVLCPIEVYGLYKDGRPAGIRILKWVEVR